MKYYLDEGKSRLQEEAFDRAIKNKKFIEEQIGKTVDALTRDRLYSLYGQEVEREMMARNREQFGFRVVDARRVPDQKIHAPAYLGRCPSLYCGLHRGDGIFPQAQGNKGLKKKRISKCPSLKEKVMRTVA